MTTWQLGALCLTLLCLFGSAQATCNKTGKYLGGLTLPAGLKPECGALYKRYLQMIAGDGVSTTQGVEVYRLATTARINVLVPQLIKDAAKKGYRLKSRDYLNDPVTVSLVYAKAGHSLVMQILEVDKTFVLATLTR